MEKKTYFAFVYNNLKRRIAKGQFLPGHKLPSAKSLCEEYHVGIYTITRVLEALKAEGMIETRPRQAPIVLNSAEVSEKSEINAILAERDSILQVYQTFALLMPILLTFSSQGLELEVMEHYDQAIKVARRGVTAGGWKVLASLDMDILKSSGNPLFCSLYSIFEMNCSLTFFAEQCDFFKENYTCKKITVPGQVIDILRRNDPYKKYCQLKAVYQELYQTVSETFKHLERNVAECPDQVDIPFDWNPFRKDYNYMRIVRDLILKIGRGEYPKGTFLPFEAQLAKQYGVSVYTVRKALDLLEVRGYTKTLNAKGTQVLLPDDSHISTALSNLVIRENALCYLYALQLMILLAHPVAECVVLRFSEEELNSLAEQFQEPNTLQFKTLFLAVREHLDLKPLRSIFVETSKITDWGFYFIYCSWDSVTLTHLKSLALEAYRRLCRKDVTGFGESWANCYRFILDSVRAYMIEKYNFKGGNTVKTPELITY